MASNRNLKGTIRLGYAGQEILFILSEHAPLRATDICRMLEKSGSSYKTSYVNLQSILRVLENNYYIKKEGKLYYLESHNGKYMVKILKNLRERNG